MNRVAPALPHRPACHDSPLALGQAKGRAGQETTPAEDAPTSSSSSFSQLHLQTEQSNLNHITVLGGIINGNKTKAGTGERP